MYTVLTQIISESPFSPFATYSFTLVMAASISVSCHLHGHTKIALSFLDNNYALLQLVQS